MPLRKKWRSVDIFNFSPHENPIMESFHHKFADISHSHAGTLLRNKRLGNQGSVKSDEHLVSTPKRDESGNALDIQLKVTIMKDDKGLGLTISGDCPVYVAEIKPSSPAEKAGVKVRDKIIEVNGKPVTKHTEVVQLIVAGSKVDLTLLRQTDNPSHTSHREPVAEHNTGSFRNSIIGPQPVDILRRKSSTSERVQTQLQDKEKTLKVLDAQLKTLPAQNVLVSSGSIKDSQPPTINVDNVSLTSDTSWTVSVPYTVSDMSSDSPHTSPSTSPTPLHSQNVESDPITADSGIEDGSQNSIVPSRPQIIGMEDDDFASEEENTGDSKIFNNLNHMKPAHMAIFMNHVLNNHNPASLLFYITADIYSHAQGSVKDMKKWAYEIHSTFIIQMAPLKVQSIDDKIMQEIESNLGRMDKEDQLRGIFNSAQFAAKINVEKLLEDLREKKEKGLVFGSFEVKDYMDKSEESKLVEKCLMPHVEKISVSGEEDEKQLAQAWVIATFLRQNGFNKVAHMNVLERLPTFVAKDKRGSKFQFGRSSQKTKNHKGHQFNLHHLIKTEFCLHCNKALWGIGYQGYQCQTCEQYVHRNCVEELKDPCDKDKKKKRVSTLIGFNKPRGGTGGTVRAALTELIVSATPIISDSEKEQIGSPTYQNQPVVTPRPLKDADDKEISNLIEGHSVTNLVHRFEPTSPDGDSPARKGTDLGRSESMKGRADQRDRPAKRSNSELLLESQLPQDLLDSSQGSSNSSLSKDSSNQSLDTLTAQIQDDSDFDVEPELPTLKQVLGDETCKKLKPKEKKRQDVINELLYTEKNHVRALKILDKLFYRPMLKEPTITQDFTKMLFPNLEIMISLHGSLNNAMKSRRKEKSVIPEIGDLLLKRFDGEEGNSFRNGCAAFCRNQSHALETLKIKIRKEPKLAQLLSDAENNPLCRRLALKDIIPKQFMRLTKYPLLIASLLKYTQPNSEEYTNLEHALTCSRQILEYVNQAVKDCENQQRLNDLQRRIDKKAIDPECEELRTFDLTKHKLIHDGGLIWNINNRKQIELHVVLLERAMVLLQKQDDRLVLKLQNTQLVAGRTDTKKHSPLLWLTNVLARNDATDKKAFFVVNTSQTGPQIYKLQAGTAEEQKTWTKFITQASEAMKKSEINSKKKIEEKQVQPVITEPGTWKDTQELEQVQYNESDNTTIVPVITPFEKLQENDESLTDLMEYRQNLLSDILRVDPSMDKYNAQEITTDLDTSEPQQLIAACQAQALQILELVKDSTANVQSRTDSGEHVESVEDLTLPIPMDRLRDMANRMNQILTNLLAQTQAAKLSPTNQAAVNSRDEERDRLRKELKFAQEELNRLRQIQKKQMEANKDKQEDGDVINVQPVQNIDTDTSTASEFDNSEEIGDVANIELNEDSSLPGLPIDPDIMSESVTLTEVLPGEPDMLKDVEAPMPYISGTGAETYDTEGEITEEESPDVEQYTEEELHENEPPEEDQIEDIEIYSYDVDAQNYKNDNDENSDQGEDIYKDENDKLMDDGESTDITTEPNDRSCEDNVGDMPSCNDLIDQSKITRDIITMERTTASQEVAEVDRNLIEDLQGCILDSATDCLSSETVSVTIQQNEQINEDLGGDAIIVIEKKVDIVEAGASQNTDTFSHYINGDNEVETLQKDNNSEIKFNNNIENKVTENIDSRSEICDNTSVMAESKCNS